MKKFLLFAILVITLTLTLSVSAFATDEVPENESATETESGEKENAFAEIYALTVDNIDKVFSALAFVSSLLLALADNAQGGEIRCEIAYLYITQLGKTNATTVK